MPITIEHLRSVQWGQEHLWECFFLDAPAPFNTWFPATDIEISTFTSNSMEVEGFNTKFLFPKSTAPIDIQLSFLDDYKHTLFYWFGKWIDTIHTDKGTLNLAQSVKPFTFRLLEPKGNVLKLETHLVYPEGSLNTHGTSDSGVSKYQIKLISTYKST